MTTINGDHISISQQVTNDNGSVTTTTTTFQDPKLIEIFKAADLNGNKQIDTAEEKAKFNELKAEHEKQAKALESLSSALGEVEAETAEGSEIGSVDSPTEDSQTAVDGKNPQTVKTPTDADKKGIFNFFKDVVNNFANKLLEGISQLLGIDLPQIGEDAAVTQPDKGQDTNTNEMTLVDFMKALATALGYKIVDNDTTVEKDKTADTKDAKVVNRPSRTIKLVTADPVAAPTDGQAVPTDGQAAPTDGQAVPADGQAAPTDGQAAPTDGQAAPTDGQAASTDGQAAPTDGQAATTDGQAAPTDGQAAPTDGQAAPTDGQAAPTDGVVKDQEEA